jgi:two-component system response regulator (stage 0 sporulation protein F)
MRVLVVDDSADVRFMLRFLLEEAGMEVEEVSSGQAALDRLLGDGDQVPDALVLDQRMPQMTGLEVAHELAGHGLRLHTVLFSAYLHPDLHAEAEDLGVVPITKSDLTALVDTLQRPLHLAA